MFSVHRHTSIINTPEGWRVFRDPALVVEARTPDEVVPALRRIEALVEGEGLHAVGFLAYEAASAFDPALETHAASGPLLWFGLYGGSETFELPPPPGLPALDWRPDQSRDEYARAIERIKALIAAGDTYQVNYTMRLRAPFDGDAWALFAQLAHAQPSPYAAFIDTGDLALCSVSPELFFRLESRALSARPMKGTAARGRTLAEDQAQAGWLHASEKNRAENVMIVDMMRNDIGRVARVGSVRVPELLTVERYPTVWQMTSTVTAETDAGLPEIMAALFPCASITGAPKARTMQIIRELERAPRRVYTGCIGSYAPGRRAQFSVAIRTALVDRAAGQAEYGVGGGIVWDSASAEEYDECLLKARVLTAPQPGFALLETLLWRPDAGYALLDRHLARLADSARYFGVPLEPALARCALEDLAATLPPADQRVRLLVSQDGTPRCEHAPLAPAPDRPVLLGIAPAPVDSANPLLYHKTTARQVYEAALAACPGCDDAVLWNERGELTETCIGNLALRLDGALLTPPVASGLLPGTLRAELLEQGTLREQTLTLADLERCEALFVLNSVRGVRPAQIRG
ncbi:MAG TPA: aminodeoxychorismate synthase component I [Roseiflexaceae bacterium]|nr:aminodeoxychorismate synthase component I [Roseiflexaceae bacterium]